MSRYKIITSYKQIRQLIKNCQATGYASIDFETSSLNYYDNSEYPLCLGVSFQPGSAWIIPLEHKESPLKGLWLKGFREFGRKVMENPKIVKVAWNFKFEYKWFMRYGIIPKGRLFDAMLAKYCLDEERPHDLKSFVDWVFEKYSGYEDTMKGKDFKNKPLDVLSKYCATDADLTLRSMIYLEPRLLKLNFYNLFRNMLMMITRVLADSEYRGILIDRPYLQNLMKVYKVKLDEIQDKMENFHKVRRFEKLHQQEIIDKAIDGIKAEISKIREQNPPNATRLIANRELKIKNTLEGNLTSKMKYEGLNLASPKQLIEFLYTKKGLGLKIIKYTVDKKTKQETDNPSTAEDVLEILKKKDKSGFIDLLLENRGLSKLDSTYISGIYPRLDPHNRIHASFKITGTVTGRLSCEDPNLQNIPRNSTAKDIKTMYIPPPGYLLFELDYSQAELRMIAELSGDKAMIEIFRKNYNIHVATACKMNGGIGQYEKVKGILKKADMMSGEDLAKPENKEFMFWTKQKKKGKSLNFSIVYLQGPQATAETLDCTVDEAKQFQEDWFKQFPGVRKWIDKIKADVKRHEYVVNIFGRKRRLYDANSWDMGKRRKAERDAVNSPIQGGSGDFTTFSEIIVRREILKGNLPRDLMQAYTVHDSIGFYIQPKDIHNVVPRVIKICENPETQRYFGFQLKHVTMKASPEIGVNWGALQEYDPWTNYHKYLDKQVIN